MANIKHSSASENWGTPIDIIERSRIVLGRIQLDPATSLEFNRYVKADNYWTIGDDSLSMQWWSMYPVNIFLNPPGGKKGKFSKTGLYWASLMDHLRYGLVKHAIFVGFSLDCLQVCQKYHPVKITQFPLCFPKDRLRFLHLDGTPSTRPSHSNVIAYIPGSVDKTELFKETFSSIGAVKL